MFHSVKKFILKDIVLEIKDIRSLQHLRTVHSEYVPWTGASIHPTALLYLLNDITIHKRKHVVECGSGISTIYIASLIKQLPQNITFHSIDHDDYWLSVVQNNLKEHNLENFVDLIHAPLTGQNKNFNSEGSGTIRVCSKNGSMEIRLTSFLSMVLPPTKITAALLGIRQVLISIQN